MRFIFPLLLLFISQQVGAVAIYTAKDIITLSDAAPSAQAVAVEGANILATGSVKDLKRTYPDAIVDRRFDEAFIVPGFINQHDHPLLAALMMDTEVIAIEDWEMPQKFFKAAFTPAEYRAELAHRLSEFSDERMFVSWGYHRLWHGELNRQILDELAPNTPVVIWQRSGHEFIFNSKALTQLGISADTLSEHPAEARAQMNVDAGHFWEQGAIAILPRLLPVLASPEKYGPALRVIKNYWQAAGATRVVEPGGLTFPWLMDIQMQELGQEGGPFRMDYIVDAKIIAAQHGISGMASKADKLIDSWGSANSRYYPKQVKMFSDGAIFSQLMQMKDGYLDGHHGEWLTPPEKFKAMFAEFWQADYQIHVHQNGDQGLDFVLDVLSENMQRYPRKDHRTTIVHFGFSTQEQVERIADLGVIVSANPYYPVALGDKYSDHGIGPERAEHMVRLGDVVRAGVPFSLHSDMPMAPGKPLFLMWCAVNRVDHEGRVIGPEQRVSPLQALKAVTIEAAYSVQQEQSIGSIEAGKLANFTVLAANPLTVDPMNIKDIDVIATVHEGTVYKND
ncbi:MAG TPA: amidohydrolase [Pseudomonadales bacterium]|nr:amidohydrolase [Pseudomonadales bacterium]